MIQMMDHLPKNAVMIAATNQIDMIDEALIRRFELKMEFHNPKKQDLDRLYDKLLYRFPKEYAKVDRVYDVSFAEAENIVMSEVKENIIQSEMLKKAVVSKQEKLSCCQ
jgi:AAA+ superfamily predicted ATPase